MDLIDDDIDLSGYMQDPEVNKIKPASDWTDEVVAHFHAPAAHRDVAFLPWKKMQNIFEFRRGEVSIIGGINGHGKSVMWGQVILGLCGQDEKVCVASLEMKPKFTMARMTKQGSGEGDPAIHFIKKFGAWTNNRLWLYDKVGNCAPEKMLALIRYAVDKFDIKHFVIDNLTKVIPGEDNYNGQKDFVNSLCGIAADLNIHIHLIMHVRKGASEDDIPNKMSLKGAGSVADMVDNIFIVWRNKRKEREVREGNMDSIEEPDALLIIEKQRNGEGEDTEGKFLYWFHRWSNQYLEDRHASPEMFRPLVTNNPLY